MNSEILPGSIDGKLSRMDIKLAVDNRLINIEMQIGNESDFNDRAMYLWAKLFTGELKRGDEYGELKQSICINIINFNMFDCPEFHSHFTVMEKNRHEVLTDKCSIIFFELKKISKNANKNNRKELWLQLINAESKEELDMLAQTGVEPIQKAVYTLYQMSEDEKIQEMAHQREISLHDEATRMGSARREGRAEGRTEGRAEGRTEGILNVARNALQRKMPIADIADITGLPLKEIERLQQQ
ncbi:MAG: Rpn family recombination-promoting nuclease/putative transposase [Oscillospiraceae bacterium]|nr:Rpn family recombination-promoting nuclease/putative transposase [Oscillospiraceae bacterium]